MKEIKVSIKDKNTLVLLEDGQTGDLINLSALEKVDLTNINKLFDEGKEKVYQERIAELEKKYQKEKENEKELALIKKENEIKEQYQKQINDLKGKIVEIESQKKLEKKDIETGFNGQIAQLRADLQNKEKEIEAAVKISLLEKEKEYSEKLAEYQKEIDQLKRQKSVSNIKQIGEDLEQWCDGVVKESLQNGFFNCTWKKDNKVIKEGEEVKGSKADFIFSIYAEEAKEIPLTAICLEMKDEDHNSVNRKKNSDYYKQLDKNRNKKECKYAVLVSNLELENIALPPILKVSEYNDMYVVRPAYLMTFLNMIVSLTTQFRECLIAKQQHELSLKESTELIEEFEYLKNTYLDRPLGILEKNIEKIRKSSEDIMKASQKIDEACAEMSRRYLQEIRDKLARFKIENLAKRIDKITEVDENS